MEDDRSLTLTFEPALEGGGASVASVRLVEPTGAEYVEAGKEGRTGYAVTLRLMQLVCKLHPAVVAKVPVSKVVEADAFFSRVMLPPPAPEEPTAPQPGDAEVLDGITIADLREPTIGELERAGVGGPGSAARLLAAVAGIPVAQALRLPVSKLREIDEHFARFLGPSPATTG